jgi:hypothetical protein
LNTLARFYCQPAGLINELRFDISRLRMSFEKSAGEVSIPAPTLRREDEAGNDARRTDGETRCDSL